MGDALAFAQLAVASLVSYTPLARKDDGVSGRGVAPRFQGRSTPPPVLELGQLALAQQMPRGGRASAVAQQLQLDGLVKVVTRCECTLAAVTRSVLTLHDKLQL